MLKKIKLKIDKQQKPIQNPNYPKHFKYRLCAAKFPRGPPPLSTETEKKHRPVNCQNMPHTCGLRLPLSAYILYMAKAAIMDISFILTAKNRIEVCGL